MEFIDRIKCLITPLRPVMTALILSDMDLTNFKQYSLSNWFQISWMETFHELIFLILKAKLR